MEVRANFGRQTHTYYAEMLDNLPPGLTFRELPAQWGHPAADGAAASWAFWKLRGLYRLLDGVNVERYPAALVGNGPVLCQQSVLLNRVPWGLDLDVVSALTGFRTRALGRTATRAFLRRSLADDRCRVIAYWSERARRGTEAYLQDDRVAAKGVIMRPAVDPRRSPPRAARADDDVRILFVGSPFDIKGGHEALDAAREVLARHPTGVRFEFVTRRPAGFAPPDDPRIEFRDPMPRDQLRTRYAASDVFFFPTLYEIFGLVAVEALAHSLPVVALDGYATPEVVTDGEEGFLVAGYQATWFDADGVPRRGFEAIRAAHTADERRRVVARLADAIDTLVRDPGLRRRMGEAGLRKTTTGSLSFAAQHRALGEVVKRFA